MPATNGHRVWDHMRKLPRFQATYIGPDLRRHNAPNPFSLLAFLRSEIPTEDISANPVVVHPHNTSRTIPERLPPATIKELSVLQPARALIATAVEWAVIATAIALSSYFWHPALYVVAVIVIGARQHALMVLGHDASHYRYLRKRWQNDLFGNLLLMWPTFASVEGFRKFHGTHHQYTNLPNDGNRQLWHTHNARGEFEPEWVFPKTRRGLAVTAPATCRVLDRDLLGRPRHRRGVFHPAASLDGRRAARLLCGSCRRFDVLWGVGRARLVLARAVLHVAHRSAVHPIDLRAQRRRSRRGRIQRHPYHAADPS